ncbi:MAG: HPr family phosphocarrier protein [Myxococcota bacterium]|nr:HPr family phosphocarrier protein [Myxococcota bacterium]
MSTEERAEGDFTVQSELGLHARPAGRFVAVAGRFQSEVEVSRGEEWVSGTSVLSILSLAAAQGTVIKIKAVGVDAQRAVEELGALIEAVDEGQ